MQRAPALCGGLRKGVSGKSYPRLCNARRPRLEPETFRSQAIRLYHLHQARPSYVMNTANSLSTENKMIRYLYDKPALGACLADIKAG